MTSRGCTYCLLPGGRGISQAAGTIFDDDEALFCHLEEEHDLVVARDGESDGEATARVGEKNPRMGGPDCRCPRCRVRRDPRVARALDLIEEVRRS